MGRGVDHVPRTASCDHYKENDTGLVASAIGLSAFLERLYSDDTLFPLCLFPPEDWKHRQFGLEGTTNGVALSTVNCGCLPVVVVPAIVCMRVSRNNVQHNMY